jgi:hypothetical protein
MDETALLACIDWVWNGFEIDLKRDGGVHRRKCSGLSPKTIDASGVFC